MLEVRASQGLQPRCRTRRAPGRDPEIDAGSFSSSSEERLGEVDPAERGGGHVLVDGGHHLDGTITLSESGAA
jgi:hypothetical protein